MKRLFEVIKKKKHKRRLAVLCLFLIALEIFCPVLSDETNLLTAAGQSDSPISSVRTFSTDEYDQKSVTVSDSQASDNHQANCNDECFCHVTALPNGAFPPLKEPFVRQETVAFNFGDRVTNSLPPPYHPPKLS